MFASSGGTGRSEMKEQALRRKPTEYVPALGWDWLTPLYDHLVFATMPEKRFKRRLLDDAAIAEGHRVLDVGSGTGTLLLLASQRCKGARFVGLDGDPKILAIARSKIEKQARAIAMVRAFCFELPFADGAFDRVLSSLTLHHLTRSERVLTLRELFRVLRAGGELHVADWGRPHNRLMALFAVAVRLADGRARTADNLDGHLPVLFRAAGFEGVSEQARYATLLGTLSLYRARKSHANPGPE